MSTKTGEKPGGKELHVIAEYPPLSESDSEDAPVLKRAADVVSFVEMVKTVTEEGREATDEERARMAGWMGWGGMSGAFERSPKPHWQEVAAQLSLLLGEQGRKEASAATPTSFFTPPPLARTLWHIASRLGFAGGRVLEPGCGSGNVLAEAPTDLPLQMMGIEREPFSAQVAQLRLPRVTIKVSPLEKMALVNGTFDLVIGNVPFASVPIYDREMRAAHLVLHNYFLYRALHALHPGGLAVLLTSRYTLDAARDSQREVLHKLGILLGALRLPSGAFSDAKTEVITDILVFQRRAPSVTWQGMPWMASRRDIVEGIDINEYYAVCPQHVIGTPRVDHGMYRGDELKIAPPDDLPLTLFLAANQLAENARANGAEFIPMDDHTAIHLPMQPREDGRREGSFHLIDGKLMRVTESALVEVLRCVPELSALVELKYAALALLEAERDLDRPDAALASLRARLNATYDAYIQKYGAIHRATLTYGQPDKETGEATISRRRPTAMLAFRDDPDYYAVLGLESFDDESQQARKAEIFERRIFVRPARKEYAETPDEALSLCLDEHGSLHLPTIARLLNVPLEKAAAALGDLVYEDTDAPGSWVMREDYLSGNVRKKLAGARRLDPQRYARNVSSLEAVQPEDLAPEEIHAQLGADWIPVDVIEQFCKELFKVEDLTISHERMTGTWELSVYKWVRSMAAITEWGTARANGFELVEAAMNRRVPIVYDKVGESQIRNVDETLAAQEKLRAICERFSAWVWEDDARATRLAALYNERFNAVVTRSYDGSHLTFPAMNPEWEKKLYSWQKDFVWRMISTPSALCGHPVGAGKTTTEIAGAMRMRQLGLISRAAIIVPNHLLEQIAAEAARLYPSARVLLISREDLNKERRKLFACRVATGDYDLVIMTHSSFQALPVHPDTEIRYIEHRAALLHDTLIQIEDTDTSHNKRTIKKLENAIEKLRQRQRALLDTPHDDGLTIEQLGISYLIVDEAHMFKNLGLPTNMPGLQAPASQRAVDLEMKLRWLAEFNKGKPFASFFTATPISNNMVEAFVLAWYLAYSSLFEYGLLTVDAFASMFIMTETKVEVSPAGGGFRLHTRPSRFVNMPEFLSLFAHFADLRNPDILDEKRPKRIEKTVTLEPSDAITSYVDTLVARYDELMSGRPREMGGGRSDNALWITGDGRAGALWLGLVGYGQGAPAPKLEAVAENVGDIFRRNQREMKHLEGKYKSFQILFCDLGTPNDERGDQVYGVLRASLIQQGIPKDGIRFVHDAKTGAQKEVLFAQCRSGAVAVLIGSTGKLGTGVNIQTRCAAVHHVDATWRPDEIEQREGRGHRPGNLYPVVHIYRYVIQRTFDAYFWQTLTRKAVFFHQMRAGKIIGREMDDMGETALSYAQVKAAATGDPLVLEQAELDVEINQLQRLFSTHARTRRREMSEAESYRYQATHTYQQRARMLAEMLARMTDKLPVFTTRKGEGLIEPKEICAAIAEQIKKSVFWGGRVLLGYWQGEPLFAVFREGEHKEWVKIQVGGETFSTRYATEDVLAFESKASWIGKQHQHLYLKALQETLTAAPGLIKREEGHAARLLADADELEAASKTPFARLPELTHRLARKAELDAYASLVATSKQDGKDHQSEIAEMRARLLATAPNWKNAAAAPMRLEVITPTLFDLEATDASPREKQRYSRKKRATPDVQQFTLLDESA